MKILNQRELPGLGSNTARLLKDAQFRHRRVNKRDLPLLHEFWEMMSIRQPAAVYFSLAENPYNSYFLRGWPAEDDPEMYHGLMVESVIPATFISNGSAAICQLALGHAQYPVLILSPRQREIITCNDAAKELFGNAMRGGDEFLLEDIAPGELGDDLLEFAQMALRDDVWAGTLLLRSGSGNMLGTKVRMSPCSIGDDIVRIALLNIPDTPVVCDVSPGEADVEDFSLKDELEGLLASCQGVDSLMFSDIQSAKGKVEVYGVGPLFSSLEWGARHAYEGTIAQDIERFSLESLSVEDTLDSIKSIDWAMFIPCGVRSYFAKPFYSASGLHAVLIFASSQPNSPALNEANFHELYETFNHIVTRWRRFLRTAQKKTAQMI